jgi:glutamine synthetase
MNSDNEAHDDSMVLLQYPDLNGVLRGILVDEDDIDHAEEEGVGFGNVIMDWFATDNHFGFLDNPEFGPADGDLIAHPDRETLAPMHWNEHSQRVLCNLKNPDGSTFDFCCRTLLSSVVDEVSYTASVGSEPEFNLLEKRDEHGVSPEAGITTIGDLYNTKVLDAYSGYFADLNRAMKGLGYKTSGFHHESASGHFETIIHHSQALHQADAFVSLRAAAQAVANNHGIEAIFMPRPFSGQDGNSGHFHLSLWDDNRNMFVDESDENGLSDLAYHFIGGILEHADGLTAVCAPTVNSYKRLKPGLWTPVTISYGFDNRSCAVRIPPERGDATRVELRFPDNAANPYLALAAAFAAGFDGIRNKIHPGEPETGNVYKSDLEDRIPASLTESLNALRNDDVLSEALGSTLIEEYTKLKQNEIDRYNDNISQWEKNEYADRL